MKVWITEYALTRGIVEAEYIKSCGANVILFKLGNSTRNRFTIKERCHESKESAIKQAEEMRQKQIASLEKQIEKLERIRFK